MIISTRGRYALRVMIDLSQQDPDSYTPLKEIAACLEDHAPECARAGQCPTRPIWEKLNNLIEDYLGSITLADFHEPAIPCKIEK